MAVPNSRGFSLIEFMVAMIIGLVMISASFVVYRQNLSDFQRQEQSGEMLENVRAALYFMEEDLRMAGFFGNVISGDSINDTNESASLAVISQDCGTAVPGGPWTFYNRTPVGYLSQASTSVINSTYPCIASSEVQAGTDVLVVKRVSQMPVTSYTNNMAYVRANSSTGTLFKYPPTSFTVGAGDTIWPYLVNIYYIRNYATTSGDGIPTLFRKTLQASSSSVGMATESGGIGEGIEKFRVLFGIDSTLDGTADYYTATPTTANLANVCSARIYILARSSKRLANYTNTKTYTLGDISTTANDAYLRRVFSTTIPMRNIINTRELNS